MCIFSRAVEHVSATKIFARGLPDGRQVLAYAMDFAATDDLAMILPLPSAGPIEFVDLSDYPALFDDLAKAFPQTFLFAAQASRGGTDLELLLEVHQVGAFEASYVPHPRDFGRLDPRFRLPPNVLAALPDYADWGFAVFQLRATEQTKVHPMALVFPQREPGAVYFPTTHVHDGSVPATAHFDHTLYAQLSPLVARLAGWTRSHGPLGGYVTHALVDGDDVGHNQAIVGELPNRDVWLRPPAGITERDLAGGGPMHSYRIHATYHYASQSHHQYPRWRQTAQRKLPALCAGVRDGLAAWTAANARGWQLAPLRPDLPPHFMNGMQLWRGRDYTQGSPTVSPGPGRVVFTPFSELVEPQWIELGFSELPSQDDAVAIHRALSALLDRAVG